MSYKFWFARKVDNPNCIVIVRDPKYQDADSFETFANDAEEVSRVLGRSMVTQYKCSCGSISYFVPSIHDALKWLAGNHSSWTNAYPDGSEDVACKCGGTVKTLRMIGVKRKDVMDNWQRFSKQIKMLTCLEASIVVDDDDEEDD